MRSEGGSIPGPPGRAAPAFLSAGFRPFFAGAGLYALVAGLAWIPLYERGSVPDFPLVPALWHGHEMLFGYAVAPLAGFLLTATPGWGGTKPIGAARLAGLFVLWLLGRIAYGFAGGLPAALVAGLDLAFLPVLALAVAPAIVRAENKRNRIFFAIVALLIASNVMVHLETLGIDSPGASYGLRLALDVFVLLIAMIGGRIVPSFTANWLGAQGREAAPFRPAFLERAAILSIALLIVADILLPESAVSGLFALAAGVLNLLRLSGWRGHRTWREPLLGVLHLGYLWLGAGLVLKGLGDLAIGLPGMVSIHGLTIGAIGTMTLAVMSRAILGHTGRPLRAAPATSAAYALISLAALLRIVMPVAAPGLYDLSVVASALAWAAAFALFSAVHLPMCLAPRSDGRAG